MKQNYKHSRRLPAFVLPPLGCFITLDLWLCTAALSSATRRAGWPRVFTTWTPMSTTSCDCCTSRGGKTSQRRRYAEWNIKGSVSGINVGCPVPPTGAITGFTQPLYKGRWHSLLDKLLRACCHSCQSGCELPRAVLWLCGDEVIFPYVKKYFFPITFIFFERQPVPCIWIKTNRLVRAGGGVMEQLQQRRHIPAGYRESHSAVERPPEQQEREAQGNPPLWLVVKQRTHISL